MWLLSWACGVVLADTLRNQMSTLLEKRQPPFQNGLSNSGSEEAKTTVVWPVAVPNTIQAHIGMEPPARCDFLKCGVVVEKKTWVSKKKKTMKPP